MSVLRASSILFLTPCFPSQNGNGLAQRAYAWLQVLSELYPEVRMVVIPVAAGRMFRFDPQTVAKCAAYTVIRPTPVEYLLNRISLLRPTQRPHFWLSETVQKRVEALIESSNPDLILVHRFYLTSCITSFLEKPNRTVPVLLDIDDIESDTRDQLSELYRQRHFVGRANAMQHSAIAYRQLENRYLHLYDRVITCSADDAELLTTRYPQIPPCISVPHSIAETRNTEYRQDGIFRFLFVGNFDYPPNRDAVEFLINDILPKLREAAGAAFEILLVGRGRLPWRIRFQLPPEVRLIGAVPDLTHWYQQANVVLAPIRFGGGTSVKVIEALAFARPLVATRCAARGVEVTEGINALLADSAVHFANQCLRVMNEAGLATELSKNARALYCRMFSEEAFQSRATQALQVCDVQVRANDV